MSKNSFIFGSAPKKTQSSKSSGAFKQALKKVPTRTTTTNGMQTFESSLDALTDLFFVIGASRGKDLTQKFEKAFQDDPVNTIKMLFWVRDVRAGAGERQTFRSLFAYLAKTHKEVAKALIAIVPEFGRWDDLLFIAQDDNMRELAFSRIKQGLANDQEQGLCAKWMPRKGVAAAHLRNYLGLSPKQYRKTLVGLTSVVEQKMCAKQWDEINFSHVPSVAAARYQKAFWKNSKDAYGAYVAALTSKDPVVKASVKINASAVYPHDICKSVAKGDSDVANAQWEALPNYMGDSRIIPMIDVSGSMGSFGNSRGGNIAPIDVAVSLGLYCADKQTGAFKDLVLTFSNNSVLEELKGSISSKMKQISTMHWDMSTNIESGFKEILRYAVQGKVPQEEMPDTLLIISDMQFNSGYIKGTAYEVAEHNFRKHGYKLPKVVFWNVNGSANNNPVTFHQNGTAMISGFSPTIMKSVLSNNLESYTPKSIMMETLNGERYKVIDTLIGNLV